MNLSLLPVEPLPPCRGYQLSALDRGSEAISSGASSILVVSPTGTGKTRLAIEACLRHRALGGVPLIVAPRRELVAQATRDAVRGGFELDRDIFIRTIQELTMPGAAIPSGVTLVVLDEARHYVAETWGALHRALPDAVFLGLDATPERADGKGLGGLFDVLIEAISIRDAIAQEFLVPFELLRPDRALMPGELAQDPVDIYFSKAEGTSAVVFARGVPGAQELAERYRARGVSAAAVWGEMPAAERDLALARFARGEIKVLTNMNLLTEGWDAPITETVILARTFSTAGGVIQAAGRGARLYPGKTRCLLIDLTGCTHHNHIGEPDEERTWQLHGIAARRATMLEVRFCPICGKPVGGTKCEECGYEGAEMRKRKPRVLGLAVDRFARQRQQTDEEKAKALSFFMRDARSRGRKPGHAFYRFQGVYGHGPTSEIKRLARSLG